MKRVLLAVAAASLLVGCGSGGGSQPDEKKMHSLLGGPPSLEGMAKKPKGAKQQQGTNAQQPPASPTSGQ